MILPFITIHAFDRQTDRQTDGQTDSFLLQSVQRGNKSASSLIDLAIAAVM